MRYLSEDGKLFNTMEECRDHENGVKNNNHKAERVKEIKDKCNSLDKILDELDGLIDCFIEDYPDTCIKDLDFLLKDIRNPQIVDDVFKAWDELGKLFKKIK